MSKNSAGIDATLQKMEKLFSKKYGIVNHTKTSEFAGLDVQLEDSSLMAGNVIPMFVSIVKNSDAKETGLDSGGAASINLKKSKVKAYGEFIERYSSGYRKNEMIDNVIFDSHENLTAKGFHCLDFSELIHFDEDVYENPQFPLFRYNKSKKISWIKGSEITNGRNVLLPAQKVLMYYPYRKEENPYIFNLSTGLACGSYYHQAALNALLEVVERDSFMLTWLLRIPGVRVDFDKARSESLTKIHDHITKYMTGEDKLFIYDISKTKGVYTILTFIRNDLDHAFGIIPAAASHFNPETALHKALEELCQSYKFAYYHLLGSEGDKYRTMNASEIDNLHKHLLYYCTGKRSKSIDFISSSGVGKLLSEMVDYSQPTDSDDYDLLVDLFRNQSQSAYLADITKPEIRSHGFHVLRGIVPGYLDLELGQQYRQLKYNRLQDYKERLGASVNTDSHPFP